MKELAAWDWDGGEFISLMTDNVVEAIYTAWNYEFDVYEFDGQDRELIFSGQQDNESNSEMLKKFGLRVIDHENHRHLQNVETGEIYIADWQKEMG